MAMIRIFLAEESENEFRMRLKKLQKEVADIAPNERGDIISQIVLLQKYLQSENIRKSNSKVER